MELNDKNDKVSMLNLAQRHTYILQELSKRGAVPVSELAERLRVSEVTIRKDLSTLEVQRKLYRSHGRAILISPYINDRHVSEKEKLYVDEKRAIGRHAASLIEPNDTIIIASGTTVLFLAREIHAQSHLTVISASTQVTSILSQAPNTEVIQLGGVVRASSVSVVGAFAETMMQQCCCSKLYIGVDGIDFEFGLTTTNVMEANLNRFMMKASQRCIVLADSSKFGRRGFSKICDLEEIDQIITDKGIAADALLQLQERGIEVTLVERSELSDLLD